jgi:hypothetical protein
MGGTCAGYVGGARAGNFEGAPSSGRPDGGGRAGKGIETGDPVRGDQASEDAKRQCVLPCFPEAALMDGEEEMSARERGYGISVKMEVFNHHLYEYRKGVRQLILHTAPLGELKIMEEKLLRWGIDYHSVPLGEDRVNLFFGNPVCIEVTRRFGKINLSDLSDEEDFILGILLGYDKIQQCRRFLEHRNRRSELAG